MNPVDFRSLNERSEEALFLTRKAHNLAGADAREAGELAARMLHAVVSEFTKLRRYTA